MLPVVPSTMSTMLAQQPNNITMYPFPRNIAADLDTDPATGQVDPNMKVSKEIFQWMLQNYIWPQMWERQPYEKQWDELLDMARATWEFDKLDLDPKSRAAKSEKLKRAQGQAKKLDEKVRVSDTIVFDAVDRLTNINHFVSFKEQLPVQYQVPPDVVLTNENKVYSPTQDLVKSANAFLRWNSEQEDVFRNHLIAARHHYTYGCSFACSEFEQKIEPIMRRQPNGTFQEVPELIRCATTFEPISIRKLWLNYRLNVYKMDYQPCPFFFEEMPRFATLANPYDAIQNYTGFVNLDKLQKGQYLFSSQETDSHAKALKQFNPDISLTQISKPEYNVELLWTFYPMLPLRVEADGTYTFDADGSKGVPMKRYIMQTFGTNITTGTQTIVRLQTNYYPHGCLPLYGSSHIPDLDSGAYSPAIGTILKNHYIQISTALTQFLENKDWINDPPTEFIIGSPALGKEVNKKGVQYEVNSPSDVKRREPHDGTQTTMEFVKVQRDQAQVSSKAVDALMGKAMGARTSATEASNIFQTSMSGVTVDINIFNHDIMGGYAQRVWEYTGLWVDPDILRAITGQFGYVIKPEDLVLRLGLKWDAGSTYVESIVRQGNLRYLLESAKFSPVINQAPLWRMLLEEWKFADIDKVINDSGFDEEVKRSTEQAIMTYMGRPVMINPDQLHQISIQVKTSFLEDRNSYWNTNPEYAINQRLLVEQIQLHQTYLQIQMAQQQADMMAQNEAAGLQSLQSEKNARDHKDAQAAQQAVSPKGNAPTTAGQVAQQG